MAATSPGSAGDTVITGPAAPSRRQRRRAPAGSRGRGRRAPPRILRPWPAPSSQARSATVPGVMPRILTPAGEAAGGSWSSGGEPGVLFTTYYPFIAVTRGWADGWTGAERYRRDPAGARQPCLRVLPRRQRPGPAPHRLPGRGPDGRGQVHLRGRLRVHREAARA